MKGYRGVGLNKMLDGAAQDKRGLAELFEDEPSHG
jgi:hypothetical protein